MRLTSTGLGIGTSSPSQKLSLVGTSTFNSFGSGPQITMTDTSGRALAFVAPGSVVDAYVGTTSNHMLNFMTGGSGKAVIDVSGNLGLGVTPSAWGSGFKAMQVGSGSNGGSIAGDTSYSVLHAVSNAYYNGGWKYNKTGEAAAMYRVYGYDGSHIWDRAPSGTAGNAITFTQAATLAADGSYYVGCTTTPDGTSGGSAFYTQSVGRRTLRVACTTSGGAGLAEFVNSNGLVGTISTSGSTTTYGTSSDYRLKNITGEITPHESGAYIDALKPKKGTWKADGSVFIGLIAHEVQEASRTPIATGTKDSDEMQAMDYSSAELIANLIAEVKSLRQRVATLEVQ
jgi:hypothetical protein